MTIREIIDNIESEVYEPMTKENDISDAIYRYSRAKEIIKENCYVFNIGDLDESTRINKALDLACTALDIIIGELEGEKKE